MSAEEEEMLLRASEGAKRPEEFCFGRGLQVQTILDELKENVKGFYFDECYSIKPRLRVREQPPEMELHSPEKCRLKALENLDVLRGRMKATKSTCIPGIEYEQIDGVAEDLEMALQAGDGSKAYDLLHRQLDTKFSAYRLLGVIRMIGSLQELEQQLEAQMEARKTEKELQEELKELK